jgi:protein-disulfide isomerase
MNKHPLIKVVVVALAGAVCFSACASGGSKQAPVSAPAPAPAPEPQVSCTEYVALACGQFGKESSACADLTKAAALFSPATCNAASRDLKFTAERVSDQRKTCDVVLARLCAEVSASSCDMVKQRLAEMDSERCKVLLDNFADVLAEVKAMEDAQKPLAADKQAAIAKDDAPSFGPANATVTLVEFSDFQCPYCSRAAEVLRAVKAKYADKVRVVFRQFPLSFHNNAHVAAEAALAAHAQGKFWQFHDRLFANQQALSRADLEKYAAEVGLKMPAFKKALDGKTYAAQVDADVDLGNGVGVRGTPTMFLNGKRVENATDSGSVLALIEAALKP